MNGWDPWGLLKQTLVTPIEGGQSLMRLNPDMGARWTLLGAAIIVGVLIAYLLPVTMGIEGSLPSPLVMVGIQLGVNLLVIVLMTVVGRVFGGQGTFPDALLLMGWFQVVMVALQVAQLVVAMVLPSLGFLVATLTVGLFFWLLTGLVCALHGFRSQILVLLGVFGTLMTAAFVLSVVLLMLGFEMPGTMDV